MKSKYRIIILILMLGLLYIGLAARLFQLQILRHSKFDRITSIKYTPPLKRISPRRGNILDRYGRLLAMNRHTYSIGINPSISKITAKLKKDISESLGLDKKILNNKLRRDRRFFWLARNVNPAKIKNLQKHRQNGLIIKRGNHRFYPQSPIASRIIGIVGVDNQGLSGIEFNFDRQLKSVASMEKENFIRDARGNIIYIPTIGDEIEKDSSAKIYLTIDSNIQYILERELAKGFKKFKPRRASAIIQNPFNGEILAMASYPSFDNNCSIPANLNDLKIMEVSQIFEPGSTFKVITAAAAIEEGVMYEGEKIDGEGGVYVVGGFPIRDENPHDFLTFEDALIYSSNIAFAKIGARLGKKKLYKYARDFGFGNFSGIRLPGEVRGILRKPDRWSGTSLSRISFGQEIAVTAVQLVGAFSAIANGGVLYEPRIIKKIKSDEKITVFDSLPIRRVISKRTAKKLSDILVDVVERGTGTKAKVKGHLVAGKTGTAQKFDLETLRYAEGEYIALFGGFLPADDPKLSIIVIFDEPDESLVWGGRVAAPVFASISKAVMNYLNIKMTASVRGCK